MGDVVLAKCKGIPYPRPRMIGDTIDRRYRILRKLGEGGMGAVYEAEHVGTRRRVAVKVINAETAKKTEMVQRFHREARAAGSIETPHIVQVFDTGTDADTGVIYMVMELLRGEDLQQLLKRLGKLPPRLALRLLGQTCLGLRKAHEAGVVHRDIKPANIFLSQHESGEVTVKLVDFGIAKIKVDVAISGEAGLTRTGGMLGSPLYMSPEQMTGRKSIDHRTDIWSLGVVLYQALTGQVPHPAESLGALVITVCFEPAPPVQDLAPWVPPEIAQIVHRALAIQEKARFPSVAEMLEAIRQLTPDGFSLHAGAIVPLTEAEQEVVAPRAVLSPEITRAPSSSAAALTPLPENALPGGEAGLSVSQGAATLRAAPGRALLIPALALSAVIGGGLVIYKLTGRGPTASPSGEEIGEARSAVAPSSSPIVAPAPPPPPPSEERTVRLAIGPADATVEVDERALAMKDGGVELRGAIGSVHQVRVRKGKQEIVRDVTITLSGVMPPAVQLDGAAEIPSARPAATSGARSPGVAPTGGPRAPSTRLTPSAKPEDPAFRKQFE
jgi:eukaryotic-like serine/threonine-protein kinase